MKIADLEARVKKMRQTIEQLKNEGRWGLAESKECILHQMEDLLISMKSERAMEGEKV